MTSTVDVGALIAAGKCVLCTRCGGVVRVSAATRCRWCNAHLPRKQEGLQPRPAAAMRAAEAGAGGLSGLPGQVLWLAVAGTPVTQGSMRAVAAGVLRRENGPKLVAWRDSITRALLRICGSDWEAVPGPVRLEAVFTIRRPTSYPKTVRVFPTAPPDVDKLLRAVQDALSPKLRKGEKPPAPGAPRQGSRFRLLRDDSVAVDSRAIKTFPTPMHTHSWALPHPGVVLRISPASLNLPPMPGCSADHPGDMPSGVDTRFAAD